MTERRQVRVDPAFFDELDEQLGSSRGPRGEPSSTDFLTMDLPTIVEEFAERFETLPVAFPGRADYRVLVTTGTLVAASVVIGQLRSDDTIVLLGIEIDLTGPTTNRGPECSRAYRARSNGQQRVLAALRWCPKTCSDQPIRARSLVSGSRSGCFAGRGRRFESDQPPLRLQGFLETPQQAAESRHQPGAPPNSFASGGTTLLWGSRRG